MEVEDNMKKTALVLILSLCIILSLSIITVGIQNYDADLDGYKNECDCFPYNPNEWKDTDHDNFGDNTDDFPQNPQLHHKSQISHVSNQMVQPQHSYYPPDCNCFNVNQQCKFIIIEWHIIDTINDIELLSPDEEDTIFVQIDNPSLSIRRSYQFFTENKNYHTFSITVCSPYEIGEWQIYFYNGLENDDITIDCNIYRAG